MSRRRRALRRALRWAGAAALVVVGTLALVTGSLWVWWLGDPADTQRSRGVNALWAAHTWVGDPHTEDEYRELVRLLRRHDISDVFFHAGPLDGRGSVRPARLRHVRDLTSAMQRLAPEIRAQAYLGQVEDRAGGPLDLDDEAVRRRIVVTATGFLDAGFDGIHYDVEPIYPGDKAFLDLLARTHEVTHRRGAVLSVALEQLEFLPGAQRVVGAVVDRYHDPTRAFLRDVAARCDQVAIMTYDTGMPLTWLFGAHMAWQTQQVVELIGDDVTVFMGVPTYGYGAPLGFHAWAENVPSGVRGVRKGLERLPRASTSNVGIALFAEWTTTPDEWEAFHRDWVAPAPR